MQRRTRSTSRSRSTWRPSVKFTADVAAVAIPPDATAPTAQAAPPVSTASSERPALTALGKRVCPTGWDESKLAAGIRAVVSWFILVMVSWIGIGRYFARAVAGCMAGINSKSIVVGCVDSALHLYSALEILVALVGIVLITCSWMLVTQTKTPPAPETAPESLCEKDRA
jgi:hypothetical protein